VYVMCKAHSIWILLCILNLMKYFLLEL
jgi:hypothetical protein